MEVILKKDVDKLGKEGDVVEVKPGFARNFLIARGLALESNPSNIKSLEIEKKKKLSKEKEELKHAQEQATKLAHLSCTVTMKAGEEGKLYGSVTTADIAQSLAKEGLDIDKKRIVIDEPINAIGVYQVTVKLHPEVTAKLKLWVVKE